MVMARTIVITDTYLIPRQKLFQYISETSFQEAFHFLYKNIFLKKIGSPYLKKANLKLVDNWICLFGNITLNASVSKNTVKFAA